MGEGERRWNANENVRAQKDTVRCSHKRSSIDTFSPTARYLRVIPHALICYDVLAAI
jgi:hypothetical protein